MNTGLTHQEEQGLAWEAEQEKIEVIPALVLNDYPGAHYATMVKDGIKTLETRMRMFTYTGDLLICCGGKSVTNNAGKALCVVHFGKGRPMTDEDVNAACIENAPKRIVYPLTNLRHLNIDFEFSKHAVKKNFQGIFSVRIPAYVLIFHKPKKEMSHE